MGPLANAVQKAAAMAYLAGGKILSIELDAVGYDKLRGEIEEHYGPGVHLEIVQEHLDPLKLFCAYGAIDIRKATP